MNAQSGNAALTNADTPLKTELKKNCSNCNLRELCMPVGLGSTELDELDRLVTTRRRIAKGEFLFCTGDVFHALFAVKTGTFKTCISLANGVEQVVGFQMTGELLGLDGLSTDAHTCHAVALEDSEVCVIDYARLDELAQQFRVLQTHLKRVMSREIIKDQGVMFLLGSLRAEQRLAAFIVNLIERQKARGFSSKEMLLRMTREDIGSYLGLKIETVSRTLSKLQRDNLIAIEQKLLKVVNVEALRERAVRSDCQGPGA